MDGDSLLVIEVFAALDPDIRAELARSVVVRELSGGERVFAEGDAGDTLFAIAGGRIRIEKQVAGDGVESKTLSLLSQGELFGEMSVIDSQPRSASAVAAEPTRLFCLSRTAFEDLLARNPQCAAGLLTSVMRAMNERIRRLNTGIVAYDEVGRAIGTCSQLPPLLEQVLRQLLPATGAEWGVIFLESEFHGILEARGWAGLKPEVLHAESPGDPGSLVAQVIRQKAGCLVSDRARDPRCTGLSSRAWEGASMILSPIIAPAGVLGVLILGHSGAGRFDVNHLNLAEGIARQTAQAIVNLRHREEQQSRARMGRQFVKF